MGWCLPSGAAPPPGAGLLISRETRGGAPPSARPAPVLLHPPEASEGPVPRRSAALNLAADRAQHVAGTEFRPRRLAAGDLGCCATRFTGLDGGLPGARILLSILVTLSP